MQLSLEMLNKLPADTVFRVVTTKIQRMYKPFEAELTFVCVKGQGDINDWAIYCHHSSKPVEWIMEQGDKVTSPDIIQNMCPCDDDVLKLYRY